MDKKSKNKSSKPMLEMPPEAIEKLRLQVDNWGKTWERFRNDSAVSGVKVVTLGDFLEMIKSLDPDSLPPDALDAPLIVNGISNFIDPFHSLEVVPMWDGNGFTSIASLVSAGGVREIYFCLADMLYQATHTEDHEEIR